MVLADPRMFVPYYCVVGYYWCSILALFSTAAALRTSATWRSSGSWREGRHGANNLDRGRVSVVVVDRVLLPVRVHCCVVVCIMSRLPLPFSDCVPVVVVATAVVFWLHLEGRMSW